MNNHRKGLVVVILIINFVIVPTCYAQEAPLSGLKKIEVFHTSESIPLQLETLKSTNIELLYYNLDAHTDLEKELSIGLPANDEAKALAMVKERLKRAKAQGRFDTLFHAAVLSKRYGLRKYPALVFNEGESVIYGVVNISRGVSLWQAAMGIDIEGLNREGSAQ